jgi:hypothetical protein
MLARGSQFRLHIISVPFVPKTSKGGDSIDQVPHMNRPRLTLPYTSINRFIILHIPT